MHLTHAELFADDRLCESVDKAHLDDLSLARAELIEQFADDMSILDAGETLVDRSRLGMITMVGLAPVLQASMTAYAPQPLTRDGGLLRFASLHNRLTDGRVPHAIA